MQPGDTVDSIPNTLLTHEQLDELEANDGVETTISVISIYNEEVGRYITRQFILRLDRIGYILLHDRDRGWVVQDRATEDDIPHVPADAEILDDVEYDDLTEALLFRSQIEGTELPDPDDAAETDTGDVDDDGDTDPDTGSQEAALDGVDENTPSVRGDGTGRTDSESSSSDLMSATGEPEIDPTAPTDARRILVCTHCESEFSEDEIEYTERNGESRWWCPNNGCVGAGVGADLLPV